MNEDDYLQLSGLQHFVFCRRQWALIHIERQWEENSLTLEGHYLHETVHDEGFTEKRGAVLLSRGMPVKSHELRVSGVCDMVELHAAPDGVSIQGREGLWKPYPVEYKHGAPNARGADEMQLCAQAMCLEEMLVVPIPEGAIYYASTRRRLAVPLTDELRGRVRAALDEMNGYFLRGYTPKVKPTAACKSCSLKEICNPRLLGAASARAYVRKTLAEEESP